MEKIEKPEFRLIGLKLPGKTTNEGGKSQIDCGNLWQKFAAENYESKIPGKLSNEIYAVYFNYDGDYTKPFAYFIGCRVKVDVQTPQHLEDLIIPAGAFTKVIAKGKMPDCV